MGWFYRAEIVNVMDDKEYKEKYMKIHDEACRKGLTYYKDPKTGYIVFTQLHLKNRGYCCKSGCRHCAYGFKKEEN